jgi:N-acetylmuramoyl-L-alanine amidase
MSRRLCARLAVALAAAALWPGPARAERAAARAARPEASGIATIEQVEWQSTEAGARLTVLVEGTVNYASHAASADRGAGLPPRAYIDLRPARLGAHVQRAPVEVEDGLLRRIRVGQFDEKTVRVVVDLAEPAIFDVRTTDRPTRLILGLKRGGTGEPSGIAGAPAAAPTAGVRAEAQPTATPAAIARVAPERTPLPTRVVEAAVPAPTATPSPARVASVATPLPAPSASPGLQASIRGRGTGRSVPGTAPTPRVRTVVLDPGHGGKDPGARGVTGDDEKDITLAIAEQVAERLRPNANLRVVLTRTDDRTVSLEQRTAIANAQGADLFVSIHANASENTHLAGVETYTLNNTDDRATIRLAAMENGLALAGAAPGERDLAYILSDLLQTGKEDESVALADSVHHELVSYLRGRWKNVHSLGVKKGPFYVLVGAYMPCVLVEVAFLTHETEGQRLASRKYQSDIAQGIAQGIRRFLDSGPANANL